MKDSVSMKVIATLLTLLGLSFSFYSEAGSFQISFGVDGRYKNIDGDKNKLELEGIFLNFRKVFSDEKGDRFIVVGQLDMDNNFEEIKPYQTYLQYKGPLGRWNIRAGHYILPFGLLSDYDTERLVLQTFEPLSLGIRLDTGIELLGFLGDFDYAVSLSQGVGINRLKDVRFAHQRQRLMVLFASFLATHQRLRLMVDNNKLVTGRIGWQGENINIGLSVLIGKVLTDEDSTMRKEIGSSSFYEKRFGLDVTKYMGPLILRGELLIGKDSKVGNAHPTVGGGLLFADYALNPKLELNLKYAHWQRSGGQNFIGAGFSYELYRGLFIRVADEYQVGKENKNVRKAHQRQRLMVAIFQTYFEFAKQF